MSSMKMRVRAGLGVIGLAMLGGCSCYPNIKSVEPQYEPEKAAGADAQAQVQLVSDGDGRIIVVARRDG